MYQWARPKIAVPTHGERRHLLEHVNLARDLQVPEAVAPRNGDMVRLAPGRAAIIDEVPAGRLYVDGGMVTPENGEALRERRHAAFNGMLDRRRRARRQGPHRLRPAGAGARPARRRRLRRSRRRSTTSPPRPKRR